MRTSFRFIRIRSLRLSRIEFCSRLKISDYDILIFNRIIRILNEIENFFRIDLDELRLARIQISELIGINLIGLEWILIRKFYQGDHKKMSHTIFFFKIFFSKIFFQLFLLRALLSMPPRSQRQNGLYVSVLWKIW